MLKSSQHAGSAIRDALGFILAAMLAMTAIEARSEIITNDAPIGRFSNDLHQREGIVSGPNCEPAPSPAYDATYRAGVDAYGNPVIPAERSRPRFQLELGAAIPLGEGEAFATLTPDQYGSDMTGRDCFPPK